MTATVDHIGINVSDYDRARAFYAAALKPLGIEIKMDFGEAVGLGSEHPFLWISRGNPGHVHVAFTAASRAAVDAFHAAALAAGGTDNGKPGVRKEYSEYYYAAFVLDPDGHNIEAVCYGD